jgi:hypothetical protein
MVIFRNITNRNTSLGLPSGARLFVKAGAEVNLQHEDFIAKARTDNRFEEKSKISRAEHLPEPKTLRKPSRKPTKAESKKAKVESKKAKPKQVELKAETVKKPKGLRKSKRAD